MDPTWLLLSREAICDAHRHQVRRKERSNHHGPERGHVRLRHLDSTPPSGQIQDGSADCDESNLRDAATESGGPARSNTSWEARSQRLNVSYIPVIRYTLSWTSGLRVDGIVDPMTWQAMIAETLAD